MKLYKRILAGTLAAFVCSVPLKSHQTVYNDTAIISVDAASSMKTADAGINLIKEYEKCRLTAYKATDNETYYTIGWGHYGADVTAGMTITQAQADQMFLNDLVKYENNVNTFLNKNNITVSQNQFDALVSFTYNCGNVWVSEPTFQLKTYLINGVNNYTAEQITTAFTNWNKQGGQVLAGLTRRRQEEAALFLNGSPATVLPGTADTGYAVPITVTADHKINTYDSNGNIESNRWIDSGDVCTINAVYTNGFVNVTYPVSSGTRTAYAKISDFTFSHSPNLCVDSVTAEPGLIKISGWAFDEDNRSKSLDIHVYMDSDNKWVGGTVCQYDDEDALKGVVGAASSYKHRFAATFNTAETGAHRINIAALDDNGGNATWSGHDVDIPADTTSPTIKEVKISNQTVNGYTVTITATDNAGIKKVAVPTWTSANGQDDLFNDWSNTALAAQVGDSTWEYYVSVSDHKNERGVYYTDVYVWDYAGNETAHRGENNLRHTVKVGMYTLTVNPNGGTMKDADWKNDTTKAVAYDTKLIYNGSNWYSVTSCIPKRTGYTFTGFYTSESGGTKVYGADGKCVNEGKYFKDNLYQQTADLTVYAQWQAEPVAGDVDADGKLSISDLVLVQKWILGVPDTKLLNWENADLCKDGILDVFDFCLLKRMLIEK